MDHLNFSTFHLIVLFLGGIAYYSIGRLAPVTGFFPKVFAGIALSAIPIAILMNFNAALARYSQLIIFGFASIVSFYFLLSSIYKTGLKNWLYTNRVILLITIVGLVLLILNSPLTTYLIDTGGNEVILKYNVHDGYFASMLLELDQADYHERIRFFDYYPITWSKYHFYNIAGLAGPTVPLKVKGLGLMDFHAARTLLLVLFVMVFIEKICILTTSNLKRVLLTGFLSMLLVSMFYSVISWNFFTSGSFSVIAIVLFCMVYFGRSDSTKKITESLFWLLIFAIATLRNAPIGGVIILILFLRHYKVILADRKVSFSLGSIGFLSAIYLLCTVLMGAASVTTEEMIFFAPSYNPDWSLRTFFGNLVSHMGLPFHKKFILYLDARILSRSSVDFLPWFIMGLLIINIFRSHLLLNKKLVVLGVLISGALAFAVYRNDLVSVASMLSMAAFPAIILSTYAGKNNTVTIAIACVALILLVALPRHLGYPAFHIVEILILTILIIELASQSALKIGTILALLVLALLVAHFPLAPVNKFLEHDPFDETHEILIESNIFNMIENSTEIDQENHNKNLNYRAHALIAGKRVYFDLKCKKSLNRLFLPKTIFKNQ